MSSRPALLLASARYWSTVAPVVRSQLVRWERRAQAIEDPILRRLALSKLSEERFNVELATALATPAPRARRGQVVEAIVALQVAYDYLDALTESPVADDLLLDPLSDGRRLFGALLDALAASGEGHGDREEHGGGEGHGDYEGHGAGEEHGDYYRGLRHTQDGGYLGELVDTVRRSLARLPAADTVAGVALHSAERCAEAQVRIHAAARGGSAGLERWARHEASGTTLGWREYLAGAGASVLAVHALIAAAGDPHTTRRDAEAIDAAYLSIGALSMLDSLLDREWDLASGQLSYVDLYDTPEQMALALAGVARAARSRAGALPGGAQHTLALAGLVAYYASAPAARGPRARPVMVAVRAQLPGAILPTLALMRAWRLAKRGRGALARAIVLVNSPERRRA